MNRDIWLGLTRHLLTSIGGIFVALGAVDANAADTAVGAVVALGGVGWSIWDKRK